jgi:hypothetical protein
MWANDQNEMITIEGEEKVFLVGSLDRCQCFEIQ